MQEKNEKLIKTFGKIIKSHRLKTKKSIYKISAESSIPKSTWERIEKGENDVKLSNYWKMSDGVEIEPDILMKELKEKLGKDFSLDDD